MLSIVIPSYKGADILRKELPPFISFLKGRQIAFEIVVVDDGSGDNGETQKVAEANGCVFCANEQNSGKGSALKNGMQKAKGTYKLFTDADIPFEYEALPLFLETLQTNKYDVVVGDRRLADSVYFNEVSKVRKLASKIFSFVVGSLMSIGNYDTQCGIKAYKAEVADVLFPMSTIKGFTFDVELLYLATKKKYTIHKLPVRLRNNDKSSVNVIRHSFQMFGDLLKIKRNQWRGLYK